YVDHGVGNPIPIGTSFSLKDLQKKGAVFHEVNSFTEIMPSIYVTGGIPRTNNFEDAGFGFKTEINGEIVADNISDDSALVIRLPEGLVIISGCAHAGLINTINYCLQQTGCDKVLAYIGGTHLAMASEERIQKTIEALQALSIDIIATAHCTGFIPAAKMQQALGSKLIKAETGMVFNY
ncbi:MAG: MBL fold metallo-hydrolase, partial [Syntrophomonadaceae bacterium]|nr:MBL fold metallo-hydrolase [Syntrophomonadaceae bacterium]